MPKLKLSKPIEIPGGQQSEFDLPETATLALFRGVKLPLTFDANSTRVDINLDAAMVTQFLSNLLHIPPSFVEKIPLVTVAEVMKSALPLLPPELQSFIRTGSGTPAT